ncbi:MAG: discoidin domain-containing protein [Clostridia bacterium]|nr:discoidin domain-containing protein [Clostridia bacterium]
MKKLLFIAAVVLTVVLALCVTSFAGLDSMYVNANTLDGNNIPGVVGQDQIKIDKGDRLYILGWAAKEGTNLEKVVWTLDGVEKDCSDVYTSRAHDLPGAIGVSADYCGHAGIGANNNYMELLGVDALDDGVYWCSVIAKYEDGTQQTLKAAFQLVVGSAQGGIFGTLIPRGGNPLSVRTHKFGVKVTVPDGYLLTSVTGIASPSWGNTGNGSDCAATAYAWKGDYATSVAGEIVGYAEEINHTDNVNMPFIFDRALPAGEYVIVLGGIGEKSVGFWCGSDLGEADAVFYDGEPAPDTDYYPGLNYVLEKEHYKYLNMDYVWLTSGSEVNENSGRGSDLGNIKAVVDSGAQYIRLIGWYYPPKQIADFGYQVDDGEIVYDSISCAFDQGTADIIKTFGPDFADANWYRNFTGDIPIQEGEHTAKLVVKFQDGTTDVIYRTRYLNDDSNIAYNKPVYTTAAGAGLGGLPYWASDFITDGSKWNHNTNIVDGKPLGWYAFADGSADFRADIYVDLDGVYDLSKITLHAMGFASETFANNYNLYTSIDGENWDLVESVTGRVGGRDSAEPYVFATSNRARYIRVEVPVGNASASLSELEAYGTFVEDASGRPPYQPLQPYFMSYRGTNANDIGGDTVWLGHTSGRLSTSFNFTTDVPFWGIGFPDYWSSANTPVKLELKNKAGEVVWSHEYTKPADGAEAWPFFGDNSDLPAGEYTCTVTLTDDTKGDDGNYTHWLVIGHGTKPLGDEYIANQYGRVGFWLFVKDGVTGEGFIVREYRQHANIDAILLDGADKGNAEGLNIVTDENSGSIKVHGWLAANYPVEKYGYKVDGGETVWDDNFMGSDPGTADEPNQDYAAIMNVAKDFFSVPGNGYRADIIVPVQAGTHTVEAVAFVNGEERHIITFTYGEEEAPVATPVEIESNNQGGVAGVWLRTTDSEDIKIEFKTNQAFTAFNIPLYWASNPPQFGDLKANIEVCLYKFDKNLKKTLEGTPVASAKYLENLGDNNVQTPFIAAGNGATLTNYSANNQGFAFILDEPAEAGQYVVVIRNDAGAGSYVVLPSASAADAVLGTDYIKYFFKSDEESNNEAVRFTLTLVDEGAFVTLDADEIDQPDEPVEPNPGTGNALAIFAVIVTLALAAVVVLKKRAF